MPKKKPLKGKPEVHKDLEGFEMNINEFGEITSNTPVDKLNKFLNDKVEDKKFKDLDDIPYSKKGKKVMDDIEFDQDDEIADLVKNMDRDFDDDIDNDEDLIDEFGEEFGEEDNYEFDDDF